MASRNRAVRRQHALRCRSVRARLSLQLLLAGARSRRGSDGARCSLSDGRGSGCAGSLRLGGGPTGTARRVRGRCGAVRARAGRGRVRAFTACCVRGGLPGRHGRGDVAGGDRAAAVGGRAAADKVPRVLLERRGAGGLGFGVDGGRRRGTPLAGGVGDDASVGDSGSAAHGGAGHGRQRTGRAGSACYRACAYAVGIPRRGASLAGYPR